MMRSLLFIIVIVIILPLSAFGQRETVVTQWVQVMLEAIRDDQARPTVHARNLHHVSAAMYDAWALYDPVAQTFLVGHKIASYQSNISAFDMPSDVETEREKAISYAAYRLLMHRFKNSPGASPSIARFNRLMVALGYDINDYNVNIENGSGVAIGNIIADIYINYGLQDGSNEVNDYENINYTPVNPPLDLNRRGNLSLLNLISRSLAKLYAIDIQ